MANLSQIALGILVIALSLLMAGYLVRRERKVTEQLQEKAAQHGWSLQRHPAARRAFRIKGRSGEIHWEMELFRSGKQQSALTLWRCMDGGYDGGPALIGVGLDRLYGQAAPGEEPRPDVNELGWQLLLRPSGWGVFAAFSPLGLQQLGIEPSGLSPQTAGSSAFQARYTVLAHSLTGAERLLSPTLERALLDWPESKSFIDYPLLVAGREEITIRLHNDRPAEQPELLEKIIGLGLALVENTRP